MFGLSKTLFLWKENQLEAIFHDCDCGVVGWMQLGSELEHRFQRRRPNHRPGHYDADDFRSNDAGNTDGHARNTHCAHRRRTGPGDHRV